MRAAEGGHLDTLKWLVEAKGGDINAKAKVTARPLPTLSSFVQLLCLIFSLFINLSQVFTSRRTGGPLFNF